MPDLKLLKMGTIDDEDVLETGAPEMEIFTRYRLPWVKPYPDAAQKEDQ